MKFWKKINDTYHYFTCHDTDLRTARGTYWLYLSGLPLGGIDGYGALKLFEVKQDVLAIGFLLLAIFQIILIAKTKENYDKKREEAKT